MRIVIGSDAKGFELKERLKELLNNLGHEIIDETPDSTFDFFDATTKVVSVLQENLADRGIVIDEYGAGPFMVANKHKGIICANVFDEHSAKMTRGHNSTSIIAIGAGVVGPVLAEKICEAFINADYDGGRHQIRIDMLNKMC